MTPKRVIGNRCSRALSVCPSSLNSSSSRLRRVGSARALNTSSMAGIIRDHLVTCQVHYASGRCLASRSSERGFAGLGMGIRLRAGRHRGLRDPGARATASAAPGATTATRAAPSTFSRTCTRTRSRRIRTGAASTRPRRRSGATSAAARDEFGVERPRALRARRCSAPTGTSTRSAGSSRPIGGPARGAVPDLRAGAPQRPLAAGHPRPRHASRARASTRRRGTTTTTWPASASP